MLENCAGGGWRGEDPPREEGYSKEYKRIELSSCPDGLVTSGSRCA